MIKGISIVICCHNSEKRIPKVLQHLRKQEYRHGISWEVLVIDNASSDRTSELARENWDHPEIELRTIDEPNPGLSNARQKGLAESRFEIVSFIDDDNWVEEHWVEKVYNHMNGNPDIGILGGRGTATFESEAPKWFSTFESAYAVGHQASESGRVNKILYGAGLNIRKEAWDHLVKNKFEFILSDRKGRSLSSGGDSELCLAVLLAGYQLYYDDDLTFYHEMPDFRVQWEYLTRLYKGFAKTGPIALIYYTYIPGSKRNPIRARSWIISVIAALMNLLRSTPGYLKIAFSDKEGSAEYLRYVYCKQYLKENIILGSRLRYYGSLIKNAAWRLEKNSGS